MQQLIPKTSQGPVQALGHLLGAHATLTRELSARLVEEHGLTMSEYEVLFLLSRQPEHSMRGREGTAPRIRSSSGRAPDRKSTRLNSSHRCISYAVLCLKKKQNN